MHDFWAKKTCIDFHAQRLARIVAACFFSQAGRARGRRMFFSQPGAGQGSPHVFFAAGPGRLSGPFPFKILKGMEAGGQKVVPKMDPFGGAQMLRNAMKTKGV